MLGVEDDVARHGNDTGARSARALRVLLAEDQYLGREGTRRLLQEHGGVDVVAVAGDYDEVARSGTPVATRRGPDGREDAADLLDGGD